MYCLKNLFAYQGHCLDTSRRVWLVEKEWPYLILALIQECALPLQVQGSTHTAPVLLPLTAFPRGEFSFILMFLSRLIHSQAYHVVKSTEPNELAQSFFSMAIIKNSFLHSWSNSHIDPSSQSHSYISISFQDSKTLNQPCFSLAAFIIKTVLISTNGVNMPVDTKLRETG